MRIAPLGAYFADGSQAVTAQDTVPFTLWGAAHHLDDYRAAIATCVRAGGNTADAIASGIVTSPPEAWRREREPLPDWVSPFDQEL